MRIPEVLSTRSLKFALACFLVILAVYASAYLALVEREPCFSGNSRRLIALALSQLDQQGNLLPPDKRPTLSPDSYLPKYLLPGQMMASFFGPAHGIDRLLRPSYWPAINYRRTGC